MLDAFIIDELRRREQEQRSVDERPALEVPEPDEPVKPEQIHSEEPEVERGVAIIDFTVG
jgi:hypothetical protein